MWVVAFEVWREKIPTSFAHLGCKNKKGRAGRWREATGGGKRPSPSNGENGEVGVWLTHWGARGTLTTRVQSENAWRFYAVG